MCCTGDLPLGGFVFLESGDHLLFDQQQGESGGSICGCLHPT